MRRTKLLSTAPLALLLLWGAEAQAQRTLEALVESEGVTVRFRPPEEGEPVGQLIAEGEIDAPPEEVFAILWDTASQDEFMPSIEESRDLSVREDQKTAYFVLSTGVPLVPNRDVISETTITQRSPERIILTFRNVEGGMGPVEGRVRVPFLRGSWELQAIDGGRRTRARYTVQADPGGNLPKSVVQDFTALTIPRVFEALRERAAAG